MFEAVRDACRCTIIIMNWGSQVFCKARQMIDCLDVGDKTKEILGHILTNVVEDLWRAIEVQR